MKALTLQNPHAHLVAINRKRVENRTWRTSYRGPLLIHAGLSKASLQGGDERRFPEMVFGAHVAIAELVGCVELAKLPGAYADQTQYAHGPVCWLLKDIKRLEHFIPAKGGQGLWVPDRSDWSDAMAQVSVMEASR